MHFQKTDKKQRELYFKHQQTQRSTEALLLNQFVHLAQNGHAGFERHPIDTPRLAIGAVQHPDLEEGGVKALLVLLAW